MTRSAEEFKARTKQLGVRVMRLVDSLPKRRSSEVVGNQLLRCATSVGANYRAACRARSNAEFCAKMGIVEEESDETVYWLELLIEAEIISSARLKDLLDESTQIVAMVVASIRTARRNRTSRDSKSPR